MKVPKSISIFGKKIKIKAGNLGPNYLGMYYMNESLIVIDKSVKDDEFLRVVVHEILHAIFDRCSINQVVTYPNEEMIVDMTTKALTEIFDLKFKK